jgi:RecB family exonuclease
MSSDDLIFPDEAEQRSDAVLAGFQTIGLRHVSASQLGMYQRCPRQWAYRYVLGLKVPPDGGLLVGSGVHHAAEQGMLHKLETGDNPEPDMAATAAAEYVDEICTSGEVRLEEGQAPSDLVDKAVRVSSMWASEAAPSVQPVEVETTFNILLAGIPVTGRLDVVTPTGVVDWKTSGKSPNRDDQARSVQTEMYAAASGGEGLSYVYLVDGARTQKVVHVDLMQSEVQQAAKLAESTVGECSQGMALGVWPRNRMGWHCSRRWCGYYERCMAGKDDAALQERAADARASAGVMW